MATITFTDETGTSRTGEIEREFFIGGQKWLAVSADGIDWLVPQGWPNNALPVCRESHPAEYAEMIEQADAAAVAA